jgi:hypothetical protein
MLSLLLKDIVIIKLVLEFLCCNEFLKIPFHCMPMLLFCQSVNIYYLKFSIVRGFHQLIDDCHCSVSNMTYNSFFFDKGLIIVS